MLIVADDDEEEDDEFVLLYLPTVEYLYSTVLHKTSFPAPRSAAAEPMMCWWGRGREIYIEYRI